MGYVGGNKFRTRDVRGGGGCWGNDGGVNQFLPTTVFHLLIAICGVDYISWTGPGGETHYSRTFNSGYSPNLIVKLLPHYNFSTLTAGVWVFESVNINQITNLVWNRFFSGSGAFGALSDYEGHSSSYCLLRLWVLSCWRGNDAGRGMTA